MENKSPILSINIPTYNRPHQIQEQVRRLLPQLNEEVVLNIYDNHSEPSVESLFNNEEKKLFKIYRNTTNIGADGNIARCFENCSTKWLWSLSDDDYVHPNAVATILKYINNNQQCVFINFWSNKPGLTNSYKEFAIKLSDQSMFSASFAMSTCIYNWDELKNDLYIYYKYLSSKIGTLIMLASNIKRTNASCFFVNNCVVNLSTDVGWDYKSYIYFSSLIKVAFNSTNEDKRLLIGYHKTNYKLIELDRKSSNISYFERFLLFVKTTQLQGLYNALFYCPKYWFKALFSVFVGSSLARFAFQKMETLIRILWGFKIDLFFSFSKFRWALVGKRLNNPYDIPIIINNFNRLEMLRRLINSLEIRGYKNIYILDNMSTYQPLLEYYKECPYKVVFLDKNYGYLALWKIDLFNQVKSGFYIYTDSDMEIDKNCPNDFVEYFLRIMKQYPKAHKVGFGIRIDDLPDHYINKANVINWERKFWEVRLDTQIFKASIDTTFALYRPYCYGPANNLVLNIRTGAPYLIRHLPWYVNSSNLSEEELFYIGNSSQSTHWTKSN